MKNEKVLMLIMLVVWLGSSCEGDLVCSGTAERVEFNLIDSTGTSILTQADTNAVVVTYVDTTNLPVVVPDVQVVETVTPNQYQITSIEMVNLAHQANAVFMLDYREQMLGQITLDTNSENTDCDPWYVTSALRFNGQMAEQNSLGTYLIKVDL